MDKNTGGEIMKVGECVALIKEGYPPSVVKRKEDGYYWRQPWHYSADWIRYDLPDDVIEPQIEEMKDETLDPILMLKYGRVGKEVDLISCKLT